MNDSQNTKQPGKELSKNHPAASTGKGGGLSRRDFIGGAAAAAFTIVPSYVLGGPGRTLPSEKLNIAAIGVGGRGAANLAALSSENIVALCDVDWRQAAPAFKRYRHAKKYRDFRRMLEKQKGIEVAKMLVGHGVDVLLVKESLEGKGPSYVLADAGVETRLTEAETLEQILAELGKPIVDLGSTDRV